MNYKVLNILNDEMILEVYLNSENDISLSLQENDIEHLTMITLNKDDAIALRDELSCLIEVM